MMDRIKIDTAQHTAILEMGVSIWNQWRVSEPLTVPNLQNADLSGFELENANLARANLRGACLDGAYLYDADFQAADLRGASLNRAVLIGTNFYRANLSDTHLERAYLAQSDLTQANLTGSHLQTADLQAALMTKATLANAHLANAEMTQSIGLTLRQVQSATDAHLAFLQSGLKSLLLPLVAARQNSIQISRAKRSAIQPTAQQPALASTSAKQIFRPQSAPEKISEGMKPSERFRRLAV